MTRPLRYKTADDLFDNCHIHNDCYVWPESPCPIPMTGPASPMAVKFGTTSVVRILFILCKYIPLGKRLVRRCQTQFCVNPFHYTESRRHMAKRAKLPDPNGLTLEQMIAREKIAEFGDAIGELNREVLDIVMQTGINIPIKQKDG